MKKCKICGSHSINEHLHDREKGKHLDLCDVCYWRRECYNITKDFHLLSRLTDQAREEAILQGITINELENKVQLLEKEKNRLIERNAGLKMTVFDLEERLARACGPAMG